MNLGSNAENRNDQEPGPSGRDDYDLDETVIIGASGADEPAPEKVKQQQPPQSGENDGQEDDLDATIIISPKKPRP